MTTRAQTTAGPDHDREPDLSALVARALEGLEREGPTALEALCKAHPLQATALRARVEQLRNIGFVGAPPKDAPLPERVGDFRILARLGSGGMGVVLLAQQESLGREVALKLVRPDLLYFPGARERFRREVEAVARLSHSGIVPVYAAGEDGGLPWCAMERVRGASLEEVLVALAGREVSTLSGGHLRRAVEALTRKRDGAAAPRASSSAAPAPIFEGSWAVACVRVARAVAEALQHAHEHGVLHRDVKPSNVMLTPDGRVLLLDFGLATAAGSERLTSSGAALGSLSWMSPEQVRGAGELDARTDVYSLGATLFELLTLRSPFAGGDAEAMRGRILEGRHIPLRDLNPAVPRDVETVCGKAMDPVRERRYTDAQAFAADLGNALERRPVTARRPGALLKAARWAQRHPARAVAAGLAVLVLVGGPVGYGLLQSSAAREQGRLNAQLEQRGRELQDALVEQTRQRQSAERASQRTLKAIDQFLQTVGSDDLRDVPGFEETRIDLLERALAFYRELETERPGDTVPLAEHARSGKVMGDILIELGRVDDARLQYAEVTTALRAQIAAHPDEPDLQWILASCLTQVGVMEQEAGRLDEAQRVFDESAALFDTLAARAEPRRDWLRDGGITAIDRARLADFQGRDEDEYRLYAQAAGIFARLLALDPDSLDYATTLAGALRGQGTAGETLGYAEESERLQRQSWAAVRGLLPRHPHDRTLREEIVQTATNLGLRLLTTPQHDEGLEIMQEALGASRSLAEDFPKNPLYRKDAAGLAINIAAELGNQKRHAEAAPFIEEACAMLEQLVAEQPDSIEHPFFLGAALSVASGMHLNLGDPARGRREGEAAVAHLRRVQASLQGSNQVANQLASALYQLADVERAVEDRAAALDACEEAFALGGGRPDILFQGAEIVGHLATAARAAAKPGDEALAARAEEICLALLTEAVEKGFNDAARLRDEVFASLQGNEAFENLVRRAGPSP